jgi:hypothetical protein
MTLTPDQQLDRIRALLAIQRAAPDALTTLAPLADAVRDLDAHLSAGGIPPEAWREGPDAPGTDDGYLAPDGTVNDEPVMYPLPSGYWIVTDAAGQEYRGRFDTEQEAEDEAEAVRAEEGDDAPVSVAYVNNA